MENLYDDGTKMIFKIFLMKSISWTMLKLKKYFHGMNVTPPPPCSPPPNQCQQHYVFTSWKIGMF
jgi:hypothetical protein